MHQQMGMKQHDFPSEHEALVYHSTPPRGKIGTLVTKPLHTPADLALAYTPGVAAPVKAIAEHPDRLYRYTNKGNSVAVITNGSAILGLGDLGPAAAKPVMEGKCMLLKQLADIDSIDLEINERDPDRLVETITSLSSGFGGIIIEDIKAPECFYLVRRLRESLAIPVLHDDQQGTAVAVAAAVINALKIVGKHLDELHVVINGAGAAAMACASILIHMGVRHERLVMCDSLGVITRHRPLLSDIKRPYATTRRLSTLQEAMVDCDLFIGVSRGNLLTADMVETMALNPIVLALANPDPELSPAEAQRARKDLIFATGRSDLPNQVNNILGLPYLFRGALDTQAMRITEEMLLAAAEAIAALAEEEVPNTLLRHYNLEQLAFGKNYLLPKVFDPRLVERVSVAVARAAMHAGVARQSIEDWESYRKQLQHRLHPYAKHPIEMAL